MFHWRRRGPDDGQNASDLRLIVGLGNPGGQYEKTRHNAGYMVVNVLAQRHDLSFKGSRQRADTTRGTLDGISFLLALPLTFMNDSGMAASRLLAYYRIPLANLLVVGDDLDLPFGTLRLRESGSSGGNGGLRSIIGEVGSEQFARLRVGVGRPRGSAIQHVLGSFSPDQMHLLPLLLGKAADAVEDWMRDGTRRAMDRHNRDWLPALEELAGAGK